MAKEQNDADREKQLAKNRKASSDAAERQRNIPAKKPRENFSQTTAPIVKEGN